MPIKESSVRVPYFSTLRFGPGTIALLVILAVSTFVLFHIGAYLYSAMILLGLVLIFIIKSVEVLSEGRPEVKTFVGRECKVIVDVNRGKRGVVKLVRSDGSIDPELWSAESDTEILSGERARVVGVKSIILVVTPAAD